jgi:hypothetical protein
MISFRQERNSSISPYKFLIVIDIFKTILYPSQTVD